MTERHGLDAIERSFYDTLPPSAYPVVRGVMQRVRMVVDDGYCPTCNGGCIGTGERPVYCEVCGAPVLPDRIRGER